jgi:hypothetical protein
LSRAQARTRQREVDAEIAKEHWRAQSIVFSAPGGTGLDEARTAAASLLGNPS